MAPAEVVPAEALAAADVALEGEEGYAGARRPRRSSSSLPDEPQQALTRRVSVTLHGELLRKFRAISGDGEHITLPQFTQALKGRLSASQAAHLFRVFDTDRTNALSIEEFVAAVDEVLHGDRRTQLQLVFRIFDRDGSSSIDRGELAAVVAEALHAENLSARDDDVAALVGAVFRDYDREGDGLLSFEEFEAWLGHEPAVASLLGLERVFALWLAGEVCAEPSAAAKGARSKPKPSLGSLVARARKALRHARDDYRVTLARALYAAACAAIVIDRAVEFAYRRHSYPTFVLSRICGGLLAFHSVLLFVTMSRPTLRRLERLRLARALIEFDALVAAHVYLGKATFVLAWIHTAAHLTTYGLVSHLRDGTQALREPATLVARTLPLSYHDLFLTHKGYGGLVPGWAGPTGLALIVGFTPMAIIGMLRRRVMAQPAAKVFRVDMFTLFYLSHLFFYAYLVLLILHAQNFWKWIVGPGAVWVADRLYLLFGHSHATLLERVQLLPGRVTKLVVRAPPRFKFHCGEYAFIKLPALSGVEWHPFTISSSALRAERFTLHVRSLGNWTTSLYGMFEARAFAADAANAASPADAPAKPTKLRLPRELTVAEPCEIRGPFGAPMTSALGRTHVVLVAAGIGVTPVASILKTLLDHHAGMDDTDCELGGGGTEAVASSGGNGAAAQPGAPPRQHAAAVRRVQRSKLQRLDVFWVNREAEAFSWFQHLLMRLESRRADDPAFAKLLQIRIFLTSFRAQADFGSQLLKLAMKHHVSTGGVDLITGLRTVSEPGRPNWDAILGAYEARPFGVPQVLFCGPKAMATELRSAARAHKCDFAMENF